MTAATVFRNARLATMAPHRPGFGMIEAGAVVCEEGRITFAGPEADLPRHRPGPRH